jgi:hypothetical protein
LQKILPHKTFNIVYCAGAGWKSFVEESRVSSHEIRLKSGGMWMFPGSPTRFTEGPAVLIADFSLVNLMFAPAKY